MTKPLRSRSFSFFGYTGGKFHIADWVISHFPKHHTFVDVFGGAGNIILSKQPSKKEIFNDLNSDIVNLFRVVREQEERFKHFIEWIPYSREEFNVARENLKTETDPFKRAVWWYYVQCICFGGSNTALGIQIRNDHRSKSEKKWSNKTKYLKIVKDRFKEVTLENQSFEYIIKTYDTDETLFYCDPPYLSTTRTCDVYQHEMTREQHITLLTMLNECKGMVVLSGYDSELYNDLLVGWKKDTIETFAYSKGMIGDLKGQTKPKRTEVLWIKPNSLNVNEKGLF